MGPPVGFVDLAAHRRGGLRGRVGSRRQQGGEGPGPISSIRVTRSGGRWPARSVDRPSPTGLH